MKKRIAPPYVQNMDHNLQQLYEHSRVDKKKTERMRSKFLCIDLIAIFIATWSR